VKLCVVLVALVGAACAPAAPATPPGPIPAGPTPVRASFDKTWAAARSVLQHRGVQLLGASRAPARNDQGMLVGTLMGEFNPVRRYDLKVYTSDCGQDRPALAHPAGDGDAHYSVAIEGDSVTSLVHVTIAVSEAGATCTTRREFEAAAQGDIKAVAESK